MLCKTFLESSSKHIHYVPNIMPDNVVINLKKRGLLLAVKSQVSQESTMIPCQKCYNRASETGDPTRGKGEDTANIQRRHSRKC